MSNVFSVYYHQKRMQSLSIYFLCNFWSFGNLPALRICVSRLSLLNGFTQLGYIATTF